MHPSSSFTWRLAAFYAALFVALGVQLPFLPLWLAAKGLDAGAIGVALALPMVVRVFAIPLATRRADRHDALHATIVIAAEPNKWRATLQFSTNRAVTETKTSRWSFTPRN